MKLQFSFALTPRIYSFLQVRDALQILKQAETERQIALWLMAASDLRASFLGQGGRQPAAADLSLLCHSIQHYLLARAEKYPKYREVIDRSCDELTRYISLFDRELEPLFKTLASDPLIEVYWASLQRQDWLGHRQGLPQRFFVSHQDDEQRMRAMQVLCEPLYSAMFQINIMLHDFVGWERCTARGGYDQLLPDRNENFGLLVIGIETPGIMPQITGNRFAIRLQFMRWPASGEAVQASEDIVYSRMLVPIA